jgi:AcrR family transcriptional regulator
MPAAPSPSKGGRPRKSDVEAKSLHIIETASRLFAQQGFAATSVEQVVAACGVGKDTVYRRYPSKLALFEGVVAYARVQTEAHFQTAMEGATGDAMEQLRAAARWLLTVNLDPTLVAFKRIAFSEALVVGQSAANRTVDPIMDRLFALLRGAQETGEIGPGDVAFLATQLINSIAVGPMIGAMLGSTTYAATAAQDAYFDKAWRLFVDGARGAITQDR